MPKKTSYLRAYTMDWNTPESDSLHLEYSYKNDDEYWFALNGGNGVFFPTVGSGQLDNPRITNNNDGTFTILGEDRKDATLFMEFKTKNFITYYDERLIKAPSISSVDMKLGANEPVEIPLDILEDLKKKWGAPEPVTPLSEMTLTLENGSLLPSQLDVPLTNGGTALFKMDWGTFANKEITENAEVLAHAVEHRYCNPLIYNRADPFIYKHTDGYYYFTASHTDPTHNLEDKYQYRKIILRRATSLDNLADNSGKYEEITVFEREPLSNGASPHIWAPEIHFVRGKWYIYYTVTTSDNTPWDIRPHVLECADANPMTGTWNNLGQVAKTDPESPAFTGFSLDHTVFEHKGELYLVWAQNYPKNSSLLLSKMSNPWTIDGPTVVIAEPEYNWETHGFKVCEGPSILKRNGRIFIVYSASGTDALYCLGMLTADENADLLNPTSWIKTPYPVLQTCRENGQFGPGHNSFTTDEYGNDIIVFHARQEERYLAQPKYQPLYDAGRNASIMRFFWNPDGTPNFAIPRPSGPQSDSYTQIKVIIIVK